VEFAPKPNRRTCHTPITTGNVYVLKLGILGVNAMEIKLVIAPQVSATFQFPPLLYGILDEECLMVVIQQKRHWKLDILLHLQFICEYAVE
jgi:hypothetical protein